MCNSDGSVNWIGMFLCYFAVDNLFSSFLHTPPEYLLSVALLACSPVQPCLCQTPLQTRCPGQPARPQVPPPAARPQVPPPAAWPPSCYSWPRPLLSPSSPPPSSQAGLAWPPLSQAMAPPPPSPPAAWPLAWPWSPRPGPGAASPPPCWPCWPQGWKEQGPPLLLAPPSAAASWAPGAEVPLPGPQCGAPSPGVAPGALVTPETPYQASWKPLPRGWSQTRRPEP